ncbi:glycosyltransferase [Salinimicrobium gaetbulicola]|uniref:Glycosyltransferase n=1 Tax=Salinimicrobium gaetbulicola TaxID=999702 RepID=A0ABW3IHF5_9FLAO
MRKKRILVAPLNWGLGHATRCIPIIKELINQGFEPVLASDGAALLLLRKEFPQLKSFELPAYNISYSTKGKFLKWKLLFKTPGILNTIRQEKIATKKLVEEENLSGIISDSRFGVRYEHLSNVFITHQLNVLSGNTTFLSSHIHRKYIQKYTECWVPDLPGRKNLSGYLGHLKHPAENIKYLGILSRFEKKDLPKKYDHMVLLSGPEPQRTLLEEKLLAELKETEKKIIFVRGVISEESFQSPSPNIHIHNYLFGRELENALNESELIISRSGYTTLMDLSKLEKKAFFIPTPGQFEQEYLASRMEKLGIAPFCKQQDFKGSMLERIKNFSGLSAPGSTGNFSGLFGLFKGK